MENVKILAIVGMSGSGKSVVVDYLTDKGYPKVYLGGMILGEMEKRGIEITEKNEKEFREMIRETEGDNWVVEQAIKEINDLVKAGQKRIVLDGVYSWTEYRIIKHEFPGCVSFLAVVTNKKLRYKRVSERQVRPLNGEEIRSRDIAEIENLEKGGPIASADYYVLNNGTKEDLRKDLNKILKEVDFG